MKATIETIALIRQADEAASNAAKAGVGAVMALVRENLGEKFPHGSAAELANLLKDGKVAPHTAKRYADLTAMAVKAIAHQSSLATSKVKPAGKAAAKQASVEASLSELAGMASMVKVRQWCKENGPKADKADKADKAPAPAEAPAPAPAEAPAPAPANIEALGQIREIREALAMVNAGQALPGEALAAIAAIVGVTLASPAAKAKAKAEAPAPAPAEAPAAMPAAA